MDVVAARLLDVDVLAGLAGPDGHQGVQWLGVAMLMTSMSFGSSAWRTSW